MRNRVLLILLFATFTCGAEDALEKVVLRLRWVHQYQFAGYYVAKEKGYYREAGLDVEIVPNGPGVKNPVEALVAGEGDFGVTGSGIVAARMSGQPVVVLASVFQHSPNIWIVRDDNQTRNIHDLVGKRLMILLPYTESLEIMAPFVAEGIPLKSLNLVPISFDIKSLVDGKADAFNGYSTNEPFTLEKMGVPYRIIHPQTYGVDFYGDVLFTTEAQIKAHPERAKAFRAASLRGWKYAMEHIDEVVAMIQTKYAPGKTTEHLRFEAEKMKGLIMPDIVEIGHSNPGRWQNIADTYAKFGLAQASNRLNGMIYDPDPHVDVSRYYRIIAVVVCVGAIAAFIAFWLHGNNVRLRKEIKAREAAEAELLRIAREDPLTGLSNRRSFNELAAHELARHDRYAKPWSLIMMDVDRFKGVNDTYGHPAGDAVLKAVAAVLKHEVRSPDLAARVGGEEFAILLPETAVQEAVPLAERLRQKIEALSITIPDGRVLKVTASFGAGSIEPGDPSIDAVMRRADGALYRAKEEGRNRVCVAPRGQTALLKKAKELAAQAS